MRDWLSALFVTASLCFLAAGSDAKFPRGGAAPAYTGLVASRARPVNNFFGTGSSQSMSRSGHVAATNITALKIAIPNFVAANPDVSIGASQSVTASVEYPAGTFTQILFSGSATGTNPDFGLIISDLTTVAIPNGATFWIRQWTSGAVYYNNWNSSFYGEYWAAGATVTDQTMSGTLVGAASQSAPPLLIIGPTTAPSAIIVGDSIAFGLGDTEDTNGATANGYNGKVGIVARNLGSVPFVNLGVSGMVASAWISSSVGKKKALGYSSHLITELGRNDLSASRTTAQITSDLQSIWALATAVNPSTKIYQSTVTMVTTDTGTPSASWTTLGQQSLVASATERVTLNTAIRATLSGATGFYELTSSLESSLNSGKWIVTPTPPYTGDGTHPTVSGYTLVQSANPIPALAYP